MKCHIRLDTVSASLTMWMQKGNDVSLLFVFSLLFVSFIKKGVTTGLIEGDMAVATMEDGGSTQQSFLINASSLWSEGRVPYKFENLELKGGQFEQIFKNEDMQLVREVLDEISNAVQCITFK